MLKLYIIITVVLFLIALIQNGYRLKDDNYPHMEKISREGDRNGVIFCVIMIIWGLFVA